MNIAVYNNAKTFAIREKLLLCFNQLQVYYLKKLEIKMEILLPFS